MSFYIYSLADPFTGEPFYIGKGCGDRAREHLRKRARTDENKRKSARIEKIRQDGSEPLAIIMIEDLSEEEAYFLEEQIISEYGRIGFEPGGILTNICLDARPPSGAGRPCCPETREKIGAAQRGELNHRFGTEWDDEQKELRRQFNLANGIKPPVRSGPMSDEQKDAIRRGNTGKKRTPEQSAYLSSIRKGKKRGPMSEETKRKIAEAQAGKPRRKMTEAEKAAHSERLRLAWARRKGLAEHPTE